VIPLPDHWDQLIFTTDEITMFLWRKNLAFVSIRVYKTLIFTGS